MALVKKHTQQAVEEFPEFARLEEAVDYYHALAKAEQRVRISRRSTNYQLTLLRKHSNLESGDLIRVASNVLGIPGEVLRIESTKIEENGDVKDFQFGDLYNENSTDLVKAFLTYNAIEAV